MADTDLNLTFSVDSTEAVDGVTQVNTALEQTATDAQAAGTAAAAAGQAITDGTTAAAPAVSAVDQAAQQLKTTLDTLATAMASPTSGPRVLFRDAAQAQLALTALKAAAADAGVTLESLGVDTKAASDQLLAAATRSSTFTIELGKLRAAGLESANQLQALQGHGTSLTGMFQEMIKTGGDTTKMIGQIGVAAGIGMVAFMGAEAAGKRLAAAIDSVTTSYLTNLDVGLKVKDTTEQYDAAQRALSAGLIQQSDTVQGLIASWQNYILSQGRGSDAAKQAALSFLGVKLAMADYGTETAKADAAAAALEGQFKNQAAANADLAAKTTALTLVQVANTAAEASGTQTAGQKHDADWRLAAAEDAVTEAQAKSTAEQFKSISVITQSQSAIDAYMAKAREMGDAIPASFRAAIDAAEALRQKNNDLLEMEKNLVAEMKNLPAAMQNSIDSEKLLAGSAKLVSDSHDKLVTSIDKILETLAQETAAANASGHAFDATVAAQTKATTALAVYAAANKLSAEQVMEMVTNQGGLVNALNTTNEALAKNQFDQYGATISQAADRTRTLAERTADLITQFKELNAVADANTAIIEKRNSAIDAAVTAEQNFAAAQSEGIAIQGKATPILMTVTAATQAQTDALVALLKAQNAYTDAVANTLTVAKGWNDYLATLADSYKTGAIDLIQYKQSLEDFQTQLEQTFSGATGNAKKQLDAMTQAIQTLINTAGAGNAGTGDTSITGQINKAFNP